MPTAYIKKLAKLNHTTVSKIEKFWAQAKEIAKSEGNGKAWGLITSIFQNKLKKEGYKVKAFKEESREVDDKEFIFKRLSLSDCVKQIKDLFDDYFKLGKKDPEYYEKLYNTKVDESTASYLLPSDDFTVYIEYNDGSKWYSVDNPKLKDLKLTGIKNCIIEYPACTAYFGKDCRIERFDNAEDAPFVVKCEAKMNKYNYKGQIITASSKKEAIKKIVAGSKNGVTAEEFIKFINSFKKKKPFNQVLEVYKCGYTFDGGVLYRVDIVDSNNYLNILVEYNKVNITEYVGFKIIKKKPMMDIKEVEKYLTTTIKKVIRSELRKGNDLVEGLL